MPAVGAFETVEASAVLPGDKIAVLKNTSDASAGFEVGAVTHVEEVWANGAYNPALEAPYMIVDDVVAPV